MTAYAFADGSVDSTRKRDDGGADYGGACAVVLKTQDAPAPLFGKAIIQGRLFKKGDGQVEAITNNTMELSAVGVAASLLEEEILREEPVHIWTDSQYAQGCLRFNTTWNPQANVKLIMGIRDLVAKPHVKIHHVRGHRRFAWNEIVNLGARKCVELHASRDGFKGEREVAISEQCFFCKRFACSDPRFGIHTSVLKNSYSPCPCSEERFTPYPSSIVENFQWKSTSKTG